MDYWGPELPQYCPGACPHFESPSNRCVSEEEGKEISKKIGKIIDIVYQRS